MLDKFKEFLSNPKGSGTAAEWFLFVGLLIVIIVAWTRILKFITAEI